MSGYEQGVRAVINLIKSKRQKAEDKIEEMLDRDQSATEIYNSPWESWIEVCERLEKEAAELLPQ